MLFFALVPWWCFSSVLRGWRGSSRAAGRGSGAEAGGPGVQRRYISAAFVLVWAILAHAAVLTLGVDRLMAQRCSRSGGLHRVVLRV